jgi:hypothetical protein
MSGAKARLGPSLAAVAAALAGCGGLETREAGDERSARGTAPTPPTYVGDPPSTDPPTARFEERTTWSGHPEEDTSSRGAFDWSRMHGRAVERGFSTVEETIQVGSRCFMRVDGGSWSEKVASDPQGLCSSALFGHPRDTIELFRTISGELREIGRGSVRGVETTRYGTDVSIGAVQGSMEYWVDADGVPRRVVQRDAEGAFVTTTDYFGFGEPVEVEPPATGP